VVTQEAVTAALGGSAAAAIRGAGGKPTLTLASSNGGTETGTVVPIQPVSAPAGMPYHAWKKSYMQNMEKEYLQQQLSHYHGNVSALSRFMKVSRPNLCRLLKKHGLHAEEYRDHAADGSGAPAVKAA
jgi:DNA-binding NtrC family response regulator